MWRKILGLVLLSQMLTAAAVAGPSEQCQRAAASAERRWALPAQLLLAIGNVESGRRDAETGLVEPWPYSANAAGSPYAFRSPLEARNVIGFLRERGIASIDVGCFQVNLHHHPTAFASVEQGFDPEANANYAARFLRQLYERTGRWEAAIGDYHSADPLLGGDYRAKVLRVWRGLRMEGVSSSSVMPGLDPGIRANVGGTAEWIAGSSPAMTPRGVVRSAAIPVYTPRTLPAALRAVLGLSPVPHTLSEK